MEQDTCSPQRSTPLLLSTLALLVIRQRLARASNLLEVDNRIIPQHGTRSLNVEMVLISIVIRRPANIT